MRTGKKRSLVLIALTAVLCGPTATAQTALGKAEHELYFRPAPDHLELFGFALVDCGFDDPTDARVKSNYLDEVAPFCNVAQICPFSVNEDLAPRLAAMNAMGVRGLLSIDGVLFDFATDPTSPSGLKASLAPDYIARWNLFLAANGTGLNTQTLAAISIVDEPTWNGVPPGDLATAADLLQLTLPAVPTLVVEAGPAVASLVLPHSVDLAAFDLYGILDPVNDATFQAILQDLKSKLVHPSQRIMLIPEAQWLPLYGQFGVTPADMGSVFLNYYLLAATDTDVIGMMTYLWPGGFDDPGQLGARQLPASAQARIRAVGLAISK